MNGGTKRYGFSLGHPIPDMEAASESGSLQGWRPNFSFIPDHQYESVSQRSADLDQNNSNASSMCTTMATSITGGSGLIPLPKIDFKTAGITQERAKEIESIQKMVFKEWAPHASPTMSWGKLLYKFVETMVVHGEILPTVHMIERPFKPFALTLKNISPMRLKSPFHDDAVKQGIRFDADGYPVTYYIAKEDFQSLDMVPVSKYTGHRINIMHTFIPRHGGAEQLRGFPLLTSSFRTAHDKADLIASELISSAITAGAAIYFKTDPSIKYPAPGSENLKEVSKIDPDNYLNYEKLDTWGIYPRST